MLGDGGDCLSRLRAMRDQEPLLGAVASNATAFGVIDRIAGDPIVLDACGPLGSTFCHTLSELREWSRSRDVPEPASSGALRAPAGRWLRPP